MATMMNCPYCGKLADPRLDACPHCGVPLRTRAAAAPPRSAAVLGARCPKCNAPVRDGDIICTRCGVNLLTGQKIAPETAPILAPSTGRNYARMALLGLLVVAGVAGIGAGVWYLLQDPVGEARRLGRAGRYLEGADILQRYLENHPDRFDAQLLMGKLYWHLGNFEKARDHFDRAARIQPQDPDAGMLAVIAASKTTGADARARWSEILDRVLQSDATNTEARYLLAALKGVAGDRQGQIREFEQIAGDPRFAVELATARALGGDPARAQQDLARAPQDADTFAANAVLLSLNGQKEQVLAKLQQAEGSSAPEAVATRLGLELLRNGDAEQALRTFQTAQQNGAAAPEAAYYYALCLQANGLDTEALQAFDRIVAAGGPYASEAAVQMALLFVQQGNLQQAREQLRKAAAGSGQSAKYYTVQGYIQMKEGAQNEAQQSFRMAIQNDPDYAPARLENGLLLVARGQLNDGVRDLEKFLSLTAGSGNSVSREIELMVNQLKQTIAAPPEAEAAALPTARS